MSHYRPYPAYKDSGVEWLGQVPEHWEQIPLKRLVRSIEQGWSPECESWPATGNEWGVLKVGCVNGGSFRSEENKALPASLEPRPELAVRMGDVLVSRANTRELVGSCVAAPQDYPTLLLCDKIYRIRIGERVTPGFLAALITVHGRRSIEIEATGASSSMLNISQSVILDLPVALPEPAEQDQIMAAASRETARIDALIEKKTRFIELLREKRQALITHAVTKGLDPNVKMKDSGVEWLGEVPEHWEVKKLKYLCRVQTGDKDTVNAVDDGEYPFFVRSQTVERINSFTADCEAVLTAGDGVGVGKVFHYYSGKFDFHQRVYMFNRFVSVGGRFFYFYLLTNFHKVALDGGAKSTVDSLRLPLIQNFDMTIPPEAEQGTIVDFIEVQGARLDVLISKIERSVGLLKERRSALITAAVTGQIDLREAV